MSKIVLVDDSVPIQQSLARLLTVVEGVEVVGCAEDVIGAISLIDRTLPDVVVLDVNLRDGDKGIDVLRYVHRQHPEMKVLTLTQFASQRLRETYVEAGASGFYDKSTEFLQVRDWVAALPRHAQTGSADARD